MATLMLSACSTVPTTPRRNGSIEPAMSEPSIKPAEQAMSNGWIDPADAVRAANEEPVNGIRGHFVLTVRAIGHEGDRTFFNSEEDYRHQTSLTIAMLTPTADKVAQRPTSKYYYQTQVWVDSPTQVEFAR